MIPYFDRTNFAVGPLTIQVWGLFVAAGIAAALALIYRLAGRYKLDRGFALDLAAWMLLGGLLGGRLLYLLAYDPLAWFADPLLAVRVWQGGMSIYGGFLGGALAGWWYCRRHRVAFLPYAHLIAFALPLGCAIGRIGCFLIHDHPGIRSASFLAVAYPGGGRLDHGLLLALLNLGIFLFFLARSRSRSGSAEPWLFWYLAIYGATRFGLDFLRVWDLPQSDARLWFLTPAQYLSLAACVSGVIALRRVLPRIGIAAPEAAAASSRT
ncbi:MAG: prolipoprotein diacylglyceryl transferase family protein [Patescibacteria group bacterium]